MNKRKITGCIPRRNAPRCCCIKRVYPPKGWQGTEAREPGWQASGQAAQAIVSRGSRTLFHDPHRARPLTLYTRGVRLYGCLALIHSYGEFNVVVSPPAAAAADSQEHYHIPTYVHDIHTYLPEYNSKIYIYIFMYIQTRTRGLYLPSRSRRHTHA